jgi:hypothetical protein
MDLDNSDFLNFFDLQHLQVGILRLKPGEKDTQEPLNRKNGQELTN